MPKDDDGSDRRVDWGNAPQWLSAVSALLLVGLAIYGLFFSATSQALVAYLQSELAVRNNRIAELELRERDLQQSVAKSREVLANLTEQRAQLDRQVAELKAEQEELSQRAKVLGSTLSSTEFSLVREKIFTGLRADSGQVRT